MKTTPLLYKMNTLRLAGFFLITLLGGSILVKGQSCPASVTTSISTYPNTYFPGHTGNLTVGSKSITLGAAWYGTTPIAPGDVVLIIQMQGAQIVSSNSKYYGDSTGVASGYKNNANLMAGNMEYAVAADSVYAAAGGTLKLTTGLKNSYKYATYGTDGAYAYQIIRVPVYYNLSLAGNITAPNWNGIAGGMVVLNVVDSLYFNGDTISANGMGFRGGTGLKLSGGTGSDTDYVTPVETDNTNGTKGEGIAGSPQYVIQGGTSYNLGAEGYPSGSMGRGAPGNAGGGGTDGDPTTNRDNTGGGGGGNGGAGGFGGDAWSSGAASGGHGGSVFTQVSPSRVVLGGGGGAGTTNDGTGTPSGGIASSGAGGGGIVIITAATFAGTGTVDIRGANANTSVLNDGSGGGGAGGTAVLYASQGMSNITVRADGGNGGSNTGKGADHGPGGGGGGGAVYANAPLNASSSVNGGAAGTTAGGVNYGSTAGATGVLTQNMTAAQLSTFPVVCSILATNFLTVDAHTENQGTVIDWTFSNEENTQTYIVEKSNDGKQFTPIANVTPAANAGSRYDYAYTDLSANTGTVYYRVEAIQYSNHEIISPVVSVVADNTPNRISLFPNPARQTAVISYVSLSSGTVTLRLLDTRGSTVLQQQHAAVAGFNALTLDNLNTIPNGLYMLTWSDGLQTHTLKLMINH